MKTTNEIVTRIIENGSASTNEELENQFDFAADEEGYTDEQIEAAKKNPWFPWIKNQAAVALGKLGGSSKSDAKRVASAANGKLGGRPKKSE